MMNLSEKDKIRGTVSVIILAAGSSSRLGRPKQLVEINGTPLLLISVREALKAEFSSVLVVLGANAREHENAIQDLPVDIIMHPEWEKGMGSSLKAGLEHMIKSRPDTSAVIIMVCDQPFLTHTHLNTLYEHYQKTKNPIIASRYNQTLGVPALFDQAFFTQLLNIKDDQGAKAIIARHQSLAEFIDWPEGRYDIDTSADLKSIENLRDKLLE